MIKRKSQNGSHSIVLLVIVVIALLGVLGFVFWQNFMQPGSDTAKTTNDTNSADVAAVDATADWETYSTTRANFNLKYPSDWTVTDTSQTPGQLVKIASPEGDASQYEVAVSFEPTSGSMVASQSGAAIAQGLSKSEKDFSEYATKKYTETINSIAVSEFDMIAQSPYFAAVFTIGDNYVILDFTQTPTKTELTTTLTSILASVREN